MKHLLLTILMSVAFLTTGITTWGQRLQVNGYQYLTFETTDGAKISVPAESLTMTFSGTTLTAGEQMFTLTNLVKMYFSDSDETTGISEDLRVKSEEFATAIYDLNGKEIVNGKLSNRKLPKGVYIVKTQNGTCKLVVK